MSEAVNRKIIAAALALLVLAAQGAWAGTPGEDLLRAVRSGDSARARTLLAGRVDPNQPLPDGSSLLSWAVDNQNHEMVQLLLDRGATPNRAAATVAPLMIACERGDPGILDMLLDAGANVALARPDGITPLSMCAGKATPAILERLIAAGAGVNRADQKGQTPLMWAAAHGRVENFQTLIKHGAEVNRGSSLGFTPLFFALKSSEPQIAEVVLAAGGNPDHVALDGTSAVQLAVYQKQYRFAAKLIERGASLTAYDRNGNQLLHAAALADQTALVKLLLAKGADPNALTGPSQVEWRYEVNFTSAPYEMPAKPPLLLAAQSGAADVMTLLLDAGANPGFKAKDGTNVVLAAATSGKVTTLDLALQLIPDANTTNSYGQTPLHVMLGGDAGPDTRAMMELLANKGARIDIRDRQGRTPADNVSEAQAGVQAAFAATFTAQTARQ